jgi:hypothetical protein
MRSDAIVAQGKNTLEVSPACDRHWCGALPVMDQVKQEARHREIKLFIVPTARAIDLLRHQPADINAVLHITC